MRSSIPFNPQKSLCACEVVDSFNPAFLDAGFCRQWILRRLHPVAGCPACGVLLTGPAVDRFYQGKQITCPACRKKFTARTGKVLRGVKADYRTILFFIFALEMGLPMLWIKRRLPGLELRTLYTYRKVFKVVRNSPESEVKK
jgi:transposase-like protein